MVGGPTSIPPGWKVLGPGKWVARNWPADWFTTAGRRVIQLDPPHQGAQYWHLNSDLKLLGKGGRWPLNHTSAPVRLMMMVDTAIDILLRAPIIAVPECLLDPKYNKYMGIPNTPEGYYEQVND